MTTSTESIDAFLRQVSATWKTNDAVAVGRNFADDGCLVNPFGERADGRPAVTTMYTQYFQTLLRGTTTAFQVNHARVVDERHVFVDAEQQILGADGAMVLDLRVPALLRREGDGWRIVDARPAMKTAAPK